MEKKEEVTYPPLTQKESKTAELSRAWRIVYPGIVLLAVFLVPVDTVLLAGLALIPYAAANLLLSLKPTLFMVFYLQRGQKTELHVPQNEKERQKYRTDGIALAALIFVCCLVMLAIWYFKRR